MGEPLPAQGPEIAALAAHFNLCALMVKVPIDYAAWVTAHPNSHANPHLVHMHSLSQNISTLFPVILNADEEALYLC